MAAPEPRISKTNEQNCETNVEIIYIRKDDIFADSENLVQDDSFREETSENGKHVVEIHEQDCFEDCLCKASSLYNAALKRTENDELIKHLNDKLTQIHVVFLKLSTQDSSSVSQCRTQRNCKIQRRINDLKILRANVQTEVEKVQYKWKGFQIDTDKETRALAEKDIDCATLELSEYITSNMTKFTKLLIDECAKDLDITTDDFAYFSLGSTARKEVTPFSDLEFGALVKENCGEDTKPKVRKLTYWLHLNVLDLGETDLRAMTIKSLNNCFEYTEGKKGDWFKDDITPSGIKFDACLPWASKIPTGRKKTKEKDAFELIMTPKEMALLQSGGGAVKEGYHLSAILVCITHLYGNESLVEEYHTERYLRENIPTNDQTPNSDEECYLECKRQQEAQDFKKKDILKLIKEDIDTYIPPLLNGLQREFRMKHAMYRMPSVLLASLKNLYQVDGNTPWEIIDNLNNNGYLSNDASQNLHTLINIGYILRQTTYLVKGAQHEKSSFLPKGHFLNPSSVGSFSIFNMDNKDILLRYYYTLMPWLGALLFHKTDLPDLKSVKLYENSKLTESFVNYKHGDFGSSIELYKNVFTDDSLGESNIIKLLKRYQSEEPMWKVVSDFTPRSNDERATSSEGDGSGLKECTQNPDIHQKLGMLHMFSQLLKDTDEAVFEKQKVKTQNTEKTGVKSINPADQTENDMDDVDSAAAIQTEESSMNGSSANEHSGEEKMDIFEKLGHNMLHFGASCVNYNVEEIMSGITSPAQFKENLENIQQLQKNIQPINDLLVAPMLRMTDMSTQMGDFVRDTVPCLSKLPVLTLEEKTLKLHEIMPNGPVDHYLSGDLIQTLSDLLQIIPQDNNVLSDITELSSWKYMTNTTLASVSCLNDVETLKLHVHSILDAIKDFQEAVGHTSEVLALQIKLICLSATLCSTMCLANNGGDDLVYSSKEGILKAWSLCSCLEPIVDAGRATPNIRGAMYFGPHCHPWARTMDGMYPASDAVVAMKRNMLDMQALSSPAISFLDD